MEIIIDEDTATEALDLEESHKGPFAKAIGEYLDKKGYSGGHVIIAESVESMENRLKKLEKFRDKCEKQLELLKKAYLKNRREYIRYKGINNKKKTTKMYRSRLTKLQSQILLLGYLLEIDTSSWIKEHSQEFSGGDIY